MTLASVGIDDVIDICQVQGTACAAVWQHGYKSVEQENCKGRYQQK